MNRWIAITLIVALPALSAAQEPPLLELETVVALLQDGRVSLAERELQRILARSDNAAARDRGERPGVPPAGPPRTVSGR